MYIIIFHGCKKNKNLQTKNCDIFLIFAHNIDCGYTLEPPQFRTAGVLTCSRNLCFREQETNAYLYTTQKLSMLMNLIL